MKPYYQDEWVTIYHWYCLNCSRRFSSDGKGEITESKLERMEVVALLEIFKEG